jgi:hypothetical protein
MLVGSSVYVGVITIVLFQDDQQLPGLVLHIQRVAQSRVDHGNVGALVPRAPR